MDTKSIALLVTVSTVLVNLILAYSGVTSTISCTVTSAIEQAYAMVLEEQIE